MVLFLFVTVLFQISLHPCHGQGGSTRYSGLEDESANTGRRKDNTRSKSGRREDDIISKTAIRGGDLISKTGERKPSYQRQEG